MKLIKKVAFVIFFLAVACSKESVTPSTPSYKKEIQGTWTGRDSHLRGAGQFFDVIVKISDKTITITFPNGKPASRDNPTVWDYTYVETSKPTSSVLQISSTYAWNVTFNATNDVMIYSNNNEDIFVLKK